MATPQPINPNVCESIGNFEVGTPEWLALRYEGIGGSDASAIMGLNPYKKIEALLHEKVHRTSRPLSGAHIDFGKMLEPLLLKDLDTHMGDELGTLRSKEHPFMLANIDGYYARGPMISGVEIKTTSQKSSKHWRSGVPASYECQLQHYLAVSGWSAFRIYCLIAPYDRKALMHRYEKYQDREEEFARYLIDASEVLIFDVLRDERLIASLIERQTEFWETVESERAKLA